MCNVIENKNHNFTTVQSRWFFIWLKLLGGFLYAGKTLFNLGLTKHLLECYLETTETLKNRTSFHTKNSCHCLHTDDEHFFFSRVLYNGCNTLTGHFIRYTLPVPNWIKFSLRTSRTIINNKNYSVSLYNDNHVVRIDKKSKIYIKNSFKSSLNIF